MTINFGAPKYKYREDQSFFLFFFFLWQLLITIDLFVIPHHDFMSNMTWWEIG